MLLRICLFWMGIFGICVSSFAYAKCSDILNEVLFEKACTKIKTFKSKRISKRPILLVALHGDTAPWASSVGQYNFAQLIAKNNTNLIAVGMLRPGYIDQEKRISDGVQGEGVGDNYDEPRVQQIAGSVEYLKQYYKAGRVILAGHSGGAATAANLIAMHPQLVDHAFLTACPCDINAWRKDMFKRTQKSVFKGQLIKTSPIDMVGRISKKISITLFVGKGDLTTKPELVKKYTSALIKAGKNAALNVIEGDHEIFFSPEVLRKMADVITSYNNALLENG